MKNYLMGLNFNPKGDDKWDQLITGETVQSSKPTTTEQKLSN
jgi:hypothetical protein